MKRAFRLIWTQVWLTGVVCLVLLALYTSLGRQLIPLVETLELDVEKVLTEQLGIAVDIESLQGDWVWFSPRIQVNNIQLGDSKQGLKIQRLEAKLDVSASLFYRVPVFDKIQLAGVRLPFTQDENNNWYLSKLLLSAKNDGPAETDFWSGDKPLWLELLGQQGEIQLYNWQVSIEAKDQVKKDIKILNLRLRNKGLQHFLDGDIQLGESAARLKTQFEVEGDLWDFTDHNGKGYLELATQSWQPWIPSYSSAWQVEKLSAGARLWVDVENGRIDNLDGYIDLPEFSVSKSNGDLQRDISFQEGRITLAGRRSGDDWHLWFDSQVEWLSDVVPPNPSGRISWLPNIAGGVQVALNEIDLAQTAFWLEDFQVLPEVYMEYIVNLQPTGLVEQVRINLIPQKDWQWGVSLDLAGVSIQGWEGIPAVDKLTAALDLNAKKGLLQARDVDTILHFPALYDNGWPLTHFDSDIFWQIDSEYLRLVSPNLRANYKEALINGGFSLYVPLEQKEGTENTFEPQLNLMLGIQNLDLIDQKIFVPKDAAVDVSSWLNENIVSGLAKQASFIFSSSLEPEAVANSQTIQLYGEVNNTELTYLPDWPKISQVKANIMVDVPDVDIWVQRAATLGGELVPNTTQIKVRTDKNTLMTLSGKLTGDANESIKYFTQTPLQKEVGGAFDFWQAKGQVESELYAQFTLSDSTVPPRIRINSQLKKVDVKVTDLDVSFKNLKGHVEYDSKLGLSSKALQGETFDGLATATIKSTVADSGFDINISAKGDAQTESIKTWLPLFMFKPITGELDYKLDLQIRPLARGGLELNIESDLSGIKVDAPVPFTKKSEEKLPFQMSVKKTRDLRIGFRYGELANGVMALEKGALKRGQVYLGTTQTFLPSDEGLSITGNIPHEINAKDWWDFWHKIKPEVSEGEAKNKSAVLTHIDLSVPEVNSWQQMMGPSHIVGDYKWNQWNFTLDSELMKGEIVLPDDLVQYAITMDLEYIHMPVVENDPNKGLKFGAAETIDPLQEFDPKWIPNTDLKVAEVFLGTSNFGRWNMTMRQQEEFTRIHINDSLSKSLVVKGDIDWRKDEQGHNTHLNLMRIQSKNLGDSQRAFRKAASVEAEKSKFDVDLSWQGSPAGFNYASLNGLAKVSLKDGVLVSDNAGALKAFGVLNFNSISRRLQLDFSDLYESGVVFDVLKTRLSIENGVATFADPLWIDGPSAKFQSSGTVNFNNDEIDQKLVVTFPITSSLPLVAVLAGLAPQIAGAIYVTEKLIGEELEQFTSASYVVSGTIEDPKMKIDQAFDNELEGKESCSFKDRFLDIFGLGGDD